jgi:phosphatidylethanolamine-binding protein (PEBP) family uncharacterized protein
MRPQPTAILGIVLVSALLMAVTACGSDSPAKEANSPAKEAKIAVRSPAIVDEALAARYTCDGQNISPPLEWGAVPANVKDLALFVVGFTPKPATKIYKASEVSVEWAVAGLSPALHKIAPGQLPAGAYTGAVSGGKRQSYSICPAKGTSVHYQLELYGVPASVTIAPHFAGISILDLLTDASGPTRADAHGSLVALYTRP